jgi:hypothetical protein
LCNRLMTNDNGSINADGPKALVPLVDLNDHKGTE